MNGLLHPYFGQMEKSQNPDPFRFLQISPFRPLAKTLKFYCKLALHYPEEIGYQVVYLLQLMAHHLFQVFSSRKSSLNLFLSRNNEGKN